MSLMIYLVACYFLGAIPSGYLAGRWLKGIDIRTQGSGNMGATNVFRVLGAGPGVVVLLVDILKGMLAVTLLAQFFGPFAGLALLGGALAAVLGHNYTPFLDFKGGKGVATSAGVCLGLAPWATVTVLGIFLVVFGLSRMVSAGSIVAATFLPLAMWYYGEAWVLLGLILAVFVWLRHIPNIKRIAAGTENQFGKKP